MSYINALTQTLGADEFSDFWVKKGSWWILGDLPMDLFACKELL